MESAAKIREACERNIKAVALRSSVGRGTAVTRVSVRDGMTCEVDEGKWHFVVDVPERWGGNDEGPNPGAYGRGALGSCLAIGYMRWAAMRDVRIDALEIEIHADYDARGELGLDDDVTPAYSEVRYVVTVTSPAPEREIVDLLDEADRLSPYLRVFTDPIPTRRELTVLRPAEATATE